MCCISTYITRVRRGTRVLRCMCSACTCACVACRVCRAVLVGEEKEMNKKLRDEMDAAFQEIQSM
jgi:phosphoribosyl 1,2-cyclic phosphodiesterase